MNCHRRFGGNDPCIPVAPARNTSVLGRERTRAQRDALELAKFGTSYRCCTLPPNRYLEGLDDGSGGAGILTLGCAKNRWADLDGYGGTWGGWVAN